MACLDKLGWRKTNLSQKQGIRLYINVMVRLIQWHSEVKLSLDVLQSYSSEKIFLTLPSYVLYFEGVSLDSRHPDQGARVEGDI